jgi:nitroimidazol reductase NimA-like FMN-containing flavoprotein (pyridoxamine 5'-phosphate oxidase superfamily)
MFGKLTTTEIDELLDRQLVGHIGCHANGLTYVVPVSYAREGDHIYVHTYNGMKMDMMRKNPKVCFQVDDTRNLAYWQSVVCWGEFEELTDADAKQHALQVLQNRVLPLLSSETMHISKDWPFPAGNNESMPGVFFRIKLTEKTGRFEKIGGEEFFAT